MTASTFLESPAEPRVRLISRVDYEQMVDAGLFEDERVELLRGNLIENPPMKPPHASTIDRLTYLLPTAIAERGRVRIQLPLAMTADSEPQPDVAVVPIGDYSRQHPSEALLVIEVSASSLATDRTVKAGIYAAGGVPEYWIINLIDRRVEVHLDPVGDAYTCPTSYGHGQRVRVRAFADIELAVDDLLPE